MVEDSELAALFEGDEHLSFLTDFQNKVKATPGSITIDAEEWVEHEILVQKALIIAKSLAETMKKLIGVRTVPPMASLLSNGHTSGCSGAMATIKWYEDIEKVEEGND